MELTPVETNGTIVLVGQPDQAFLARAEDVTHLIEQCFGACARALVLYPPNLPAAFFDLSSGAAGVILQKLQTYGIRLAIVAAPGSVQLSSRFGELLADERNGRQFGMFDTEAAAYAWLQK